MSRQVEFLMNEVVDLENRNRQNNVTVYGINEQEEIQSHLKFPF